ncbi:MAG: hypothetical protein JWO94_288, partial [Verrucomicrobiaceae bacterium]|nr:hypothetical protein [Verrucomicrobiaceae bacterium]
MEVNAADGRQQIKVNLADDNPVLHRNGGFDRGPGIIPFQGEILELEAINVLDRWVQRHRRQGPGLPQELLLGLIEMIGIEMQVAEGMHEVAGLETAHLGDHEGEQGVAGDVEGDAEKKISTALVELAAQFAIRHEKLKQAMAGRQG